MGRLSGLLHKKLDMLWNRHLACSCKWKFIKLEEQTVTIGLREYSLPPVAEILGILVSFII
jgi:hypothetical protein